MANVLYLVHRLPYPPDKGDKVRSFHLLKHLLKEHRVFLGTFVDDPDDEAHVDVLRGWCADLHVARLNPARARIASLVGLWRQESLTLGYYRDAGLAHWAEQVMATQGIDAVIVFSSSMAQYAGQRPGVPVLVDFVDVDSAKWTAYADARTWPMSWLYRREGTQLLAYERSVAKRAAQSFFVTGKETALFLSLAPECSGSVEVMGNGVDADHFAPDAARVSPFAAGEIPLVFTGAMDYWPNVDAVTWFSREVVPLLRARWPALRFHIVGRSPLASVQSLAGDAVVVSGTVPDVRPYLQHAAAVVAPLRLARGIQNKVLEAMAMARPVVAAAACAEAIDARPGTDLLVASTAEDYLRELDALLRSPDQSARVGASGRERVIERYGWAAHLSRLDRHLRLAPRVALAA